MRKAGIVLLVLWALLFLGGAVGEIFEVDFLREATDIKRIFLR
jgi:hypothetical protein